LAALLAEQCFKERLRNPWSNFKLSCKRWCVDQCYLHITCARRSQTDSCACTRTQKQRNVELSLELDAAHEHVQKAEEELAATRETMERFESEATVLRDAAETNRLKSTAAHKQLQAQEVTIAELTQKLGNAEAEVAVLRQRLNASGSATAKESEQLRSERDAALWTAKEAEARLAEAEKELAMLRQQKATIEKQKREAAEVAAAAEHTWSKELAEAQRILALKDRELSEKEAELQSLRASRKELVCVFPLLQCLCPIFCTHEAPPSLSFFAHARAHRKQSSAEYKTSYCVPGQRHHLLSMLTTFSRKCLQWQTLHSDDHEPTNKEEMRDMQHSITGSSSVRLNCHAGDVAAFPLFSSQRVLPLQGTEFQ